MLLTSWVYISTYMLFSIICTVYSTAIGSVECPIEWIDGSDITLICNINEASLNTCTVTGFVDFTFIPNGSTIPLSQCTVDRINVDCRNVLNSQGCGCRDHSGGNYILNYKIKANKTIHSGGSWGCEADCLKIPTQGCSNIIVVIDDGKWCDGTNANKCKTGSICEGNRCKTKDQPPPCPTWCIIVIVFATILGIIIIIVICVIIHYLTSRLHWRCVCICCIASTPNDMHRGQCCLFCCLIPNTRPTQDNGPSLELK